MSSYRNHRKIEILCDGSGCHEFIEGEGNLQDIWNAAKIDGWRSRQISGEWFNYCPDCANAPPPTIDFIALMNKKF